MKSVIQLLKSLLSRWIKSRLSLEERAEIDRQFSCEGKFRHDSMQKATVAAYSLEQNYPGREREPYRCCYCGMYHVGRVKDRSMFSYEHRPEGYRPTED